MKITGPNGVVADVDKENRLSVFSITQNEDRHANEEGRSWSVFIQATPTGSNSKFFYLKNNGTKDLIITTTRFSSSVITKLFYKIVTGTVGGGTPVTQITNRNLGETASPNAEIQQGVGASLTGLTDVGILFFEDCKPADERKTLKPNSSIIIPQGRAIAFERVELTGVITGVISLSEAE